MLNNLFHGKVKEEAVNKLVVLFKAKTGWQYLWFNLKCAKLIEDMIFYTRNRSNLLFISTDSGTTIKNNKS